MSKYIFYHIYCCENTEPIVRDQVIKILFSGLYDNVDCIYCFLAGIPQYIDLIIFILQTSGKKFKIEQIGIYDKSFERFTIHKIKNYIQNEDKILYIHSKGASYRGWSNITNWRNFMEYYVIRHHEECIKLLDEYDTVGIQLLYDPFTHYCGNFWWCRGDYFLKLPDISTLTVKEECRCSYTENYVGLNNPRAYTLNHTKKNLYNDVFLLYEYVDSPPARAEGAATILMQHTN